MSHLVVLDNEAVGALASPDHPKHRRALAHVQVVATRRRRAATVSLVVPTSVRVEAGPDRTAPGASLLWSLRIADAVLDSSTTDVAARVRTETGVSVAGAHIGAVVTTSEADRVTVLTSDPKNVQAASAPTSVTIVRL